MCTQAIALATKGIVCCGNFVINVIQRYVLPFVISVLRNPIAFTTKLKNSLKINIKSVNTIQIVNTLQNLFKYNITKQSNIKIKINKICD